MRASAIFATSPHVADLKCKLVDDDLLKEQATPLHPLGRLSNMFTIRAFCPTPASSLPPCTVPVPCLYPPAAHTVLQRSAYRLYSMVVAPESDPPCLLSAAPRHVPLRTSMPQASNTALCSTTPPSHPLPDPPPSPAPISSLRISLLTDVIVGLLFQPNLPHSLCLTLPPYPSTISYPPPSLPACVTC